MVADFAKNFRADPPVAAARQAAAERPPKPWPLRLPESPVAAARQAAAEHPPKPWRLRLPDSPVAAVRQAAERAATKALAASATGFPGSGGPPGRRTSLQPKPWRLRLRCATIKTPPSISFPLSSMKYVIVIPDGCADEPIQSLGGRTPLQAANLPAIDALARAGRLAMTNNTPADYPAGSEIANLILLGHDPATAFTGRAALEAAAADIHLGPYDCAVRCNLVTIADQIMIDFTADHIDSADAAALLRDLNDRVLGGNGPLADNPIARRLTFVPGVSYRHLLLYRGDEAYPSPWTAASRSTAPHDLTDLPIGDGYPRGPGSDTLVQIMEHASSVLGDHPINGRRVAAGKSPATDVWLWSSGGAPKLTPFEQKHGLSGVMITAVDLLRGIAALIGWPRIEVDGATGYLDTDYAAKGRAAIAALKNYDVVCVHIEAPDEASHEGRPDAKIEAMEKIDRHIVGPIADHLHGSDHRILVLPDHPTLCRTKKHTHGPVPLVMAGTGIKPDAAQTFDEPSATASGKVYDPGWTMIDDFLATSPMAEH